MERVDAAGAELVVATLRTQVLCAGEDQLGDGGGLEARIAFQEQGYDAADVSRRKRRSGQVGVLALLDRRQDVDAGRGNANVAAAIGELVQAVALIEGR